MSEGHTAGLEMNLYKTKLLSNRQKEDYLKLQKIKITKVQEAVHLGQTVSLGPRIDKCFNEIMFIKINLLVFHQILMCKTYHGKYMHKCDTLDL